MDRITGSTTLSSQRLSVAALAVLGGGLMAAFGLLSLGRSANLGEAQRIVAKIQRGEAVDAQAGEKARETLRQSREGGTLSLAGVVAAEEARKAGFGTPQGRAWLQKALSDFRSGLSRAPADGLSWLRLSGAEVLLRGPSPASLGALQMASYTARTTSWTEPLFLNVSAAQWGLMDAGLKERAAATARRMWASELLRPSLGRLALTPGGRQLLLESIQPVAEVNAWIETQIANAEAGRGLRRAAPSN